MPQTSFACVLVKNLLLHVLRKYLSIDVYQAIFFVSQCLRPSTTPQPILVGRGRGQPALPTVGQNSPGRCHGWVGPPHPLGWRLTPRPALHSPANLPGGSWARGLGMSFSAKHQNMSGKCPWGGPSFWGSRVGWMGAGTPPPRGLKRSLIAGFFFPCLFLSSWFNTENLWQMCRRMQSRRCVVVL